MKKHQAKPKHPNKRAEGGFSNIELAILLIMVGGVMALAGQYMKIYNLERRYDDSLDNIKVADDALRLYFIINGRYPCPADPTLPDTDVNYGLEQCRADIIADPCPVNLSCTNTWGRGDVDNADGDGDPNTGRDGIVIGMIPVNTLINALNTGNKNPFTKKQSLDGYLNRYTYAVTELLTEITASYAHPVNPHLGTIDIRDENHFSVLDPDSSAHFILISHGLNGEGAFNDNGIQATPCNTNVITLPGNPETPEPPNGGIQPINPDGTHTQKPEKENCDKNDAIFIKGILNINDDNTNVYFDDIVVYEGEGFRPLWTDVIDDDTTVEPDIDPGESYIHNTNLGFVGVGAVGLGGSTPQNYLHVAGNAQAENVIIAEKYCVANDVNPDNEDCFDPAALSGTVGIKCPLGQAATGFNNNQLVCEDVFPAGFNFAALNVCPAGTGIVGISNKEHVKCGPPPPP